MTLRARLTAAFLAVVLGPVLIGSVFVGGTVATVAQTRSAERLEIAATAVHTTISAICNSLKVRAKSAVITASEGVVRQRLTGEAALKAVVSSVSGSPTTVIRIDDLNGEIRYSGGDQPGPWVRCNDKNDTGVNREAFALSWRVPLHDAGRKTYGFLEVAEPVDANLLKSLSNAAGVEVAVLDGRDPPLSSLSDSRSRIIARYARGLLKEQVKQTEDGWYVRTLQPAGTNQPLRLALATSRGEEQGMFAVLLAVVVLSGLLAIGAAWTLARSTTRPLAELSRAADRVAGGDLDARVPVRSSDEVGRLATTFNRMTREMQAYVEALTASRDQLRGNLGLLGDTLSSTHDLGRILEVILETAMAATGAQAGVVLLMEHPDARRPGMLVARCSRGLGDRAADSDEVRLLLGEGLLGGVAASNEPRRGRVDWDGPLLSDREPRCRTYVAVPFSGTRHGDGEEPTQPGRLLGVLALYDRLGHDDFDDADLITLRTFAGQAAVAVENVLLHEETHRLSLTDPLTGLWNYRYLKESVRREVERANRFHRQLAVLALDLDRFKDINDTHGHPVGDAVLIEFARRVRQETREVDLAFRQGGEEFVVLLPETDGLGGARVAERLCAAIREHPFDVENGDGTSSAIQVTVSAGIAVYPDDGSTDAEVLEAADDALYAAKAAGRDTHRVAGGHA